MKIVIKSEFAPKAIGPYSQAIVTGNLIFVSGQLPIDIKTGNMATGPDAVVAQTKQSLENIKNILTSAGATLSDVLKTVIFLKDMNDFSKVNEVYQQYFTTEFPARSCIEISRLPKDALVEIEAIASKPV